ncbi:MAG TPA: MBL fold metallo-hydrolase [Actinomycetota bacterium]|nr:MBL fold metallo-hydrolase [Actinomycetota bacterium]
MIQHRRREPAPGVFRLVLPLPWPGLDRVNAYALADDEGVILVDCGARDPAVETGHELDHLEAALRAVGFELSDVRRLILTHPHPDHFGLAGRLVDETGCEVWIHSSSREELDFYRDPVAARERIRALLAGHGIGGNDLQELTGFVDWSAFLTGIIEATRTLNDRDEFRVGDRSWTIVHTPGHSRSHVCLWAAADRLLISGDHLLGTITPHIDYHGDGDPLGDFLGSLRKIEQLDPGLVLPGHGRPFSDGGARARSVVRHHDRRLGSILQVVRREPHSLDEITDGIFGSTLLNFQRRLALGEALAHLVYLVKRGEVEQLGDDGAYRYRKKPRGESRGS